MPRVLFVSKPIAPPYHDGTKCLVRDVATHLVRHSAVVLSTPGGTGLGAVERRLRVEPVYRSSGSFSPGLAENARAAAWLIGRSRADLWHFVFAPNPKTSAVGRVARTLRRVPVVQTVASPPLRMVPSTFFGDLVVAQSRHTRDRIVQAFRGESLPRIEVIPPPVAAIEPRSPDAVRAVRARLSLSEGAPVIVYPGDLEVSVGAETMAQAVVPLRRLVRDAIVVFACRGKTPRAPALRRSLESRLDPATVRFVDDVDLPALVQAASVVAFPVDDLRGKVDLPISLLEAMQLEVPVVAWDHGPLADLQGVDLVPPFDVPLFVDRLARIVCDPVHRQAVVTAQLDAVEQTYAATKVARAYEALYDELLETWKGTPTERGAESAKGAENF